ncbi:MAG: hypothetical protein ABW124_20330 [Candidatus Thiodiazotropha sp. 6PLUC9]
MKLYINVILFTGAALTRQFHLDALLSVGFPDTYVGMLNAVECKEDPDSERRDRELAIYR